MKSTIQNRTVQSNSEIRELSKRQLEGKWRAAALTAFVYSLIISLLDYIPIPGSTIGPFGEGLIWGQELDIPIISTLLSGAFGIGLSVYHLKIAKNRDPELGNIFDGFKQFVQSIIAGVLTSLVILTGLVFFIIPGIIASLGLSQTYFIMSENPGINAVDAMKQSWEMTKGYKGQLFLLGLSFIPWVFLSIFTLFIGLFWLMPYVYVSFSNFYLQLKDEDIDLNLEDHLID